jgi:hypothetical protein
MQVARDQFNDVGEPVLANWCDHIYGDLIVDVLAVALPPSSARSTLSGFKIFSLVPVSFKSVYLMLRVSESMKNLLPEGVKFVPMRWETEKQCLSDEIGAARVREKGSITGRVATQGLGWLLERHGH